MGYLLKTCLKADKCPNRTINDDKLMDRLESLLKKEDLAEFLKKNIRGKIKPHHKFRITLAGCPNACSQPQIKDIGIIGALIPEISNKKCIMCGICVEICQENAIKFFTGKKAPEIDYNLCMKCGKCVNECSTGTIKKGREGFRILLGGKLGRHPQLGLELNGIYNENEVLKIIKKCIGIFKQNTRDGKRFTEIIHTCRQDFPGRSIGYPMLPPQTRT